MAPMALEGIRVADFSWVWAGPFCSLQLAHLGAEVIKIETQKRLDTVRLLPPWDNNEPNPNTSGYFNQYSMNKLGITLDLATPEGRGLAKRLVAVSDVVVENFAPRVMPGLGLGYDDLVKVKPDIIMISLSGYGATGPDSDYVSYGPAQVPLSGLAMLSGYEDGPPQGVGISYGDPTGGLHGAIAVLAALLYRQRTGRGQHIDLSQWETSIAVLPEGVLAQTMEGSQPPRRGNHDPLDAPHNAYRAAGEDRWISIAVTSDEEWERFRGALADQGWVHDPRFATAEGRKRHEAELDARITEWTRARDAKEAAALLQSHGVAAFPTMDHRDLVEDPHLQERGFWVTPDHPLVGKKVHPGIPWKLSATPALVRRAAPLLGQHNEYVFRDLLGLSEEEIADLKDRKVIF